MTTIIIIFSALFIIAFVVLCLFKGNGSSSDDNVETPVSTGNGNNNDGWRLESLATGQKVDINGELAEIRNIALIHDGKPSWKYKYSVQLRWKVTTSELEQEFSGDVAPEKIFIINGKEYYGLVLAGGPEAQIVESKINMTIK